MLTSRLHGFPRRRRVSSVFALVFLSLRQISTMHLAPFTPRIILFSLDFSTYAEFQSR